MEPKKNPKYDVHRKSNMIFMLSLAITFSLVIMAFQWKVPLPTDGGLNVDRKEDLTDLAFTELKSITTQTPTPEKEEKKVPVKKLIDPSRIIEVRDEVFNTQENEPIIDDQNAPQHQFGIELGEPLPPEKTDTIFRIVEKMPEPVGGLKGFYETIQKNIKYPGPAKRNQVEGKVVVEFVINEDDHLSDFTILSGIGGGCNEEAKRVIGLTKWKAGKQRGRPVKVRMALPLTFRLQ